MYVSAPILLIDWASDRWSSARVASQPPPDLQDVLPAIIISRFGGRDVELTIDRAQVDVDVYAGSPVAADDLAVEVFSDFRSVLPGTLITTVSGRGVVASVTTMTGPSIRPVTDSNLSRVGMTFEVRIQAR